MLSLFVSLRVRPGMTGRFLAAVRENARSSLREEPGCLRFDVHADADDPAHFLLYELYADEAAFREVHRATPHFRAWRVVADQVIEPGSQVNTVCTPAFPEDLPEAGGRA